MDMLVLVLSGLSIAIGVIALLIGSDFKNFRIRFSAKNDFGCCNVG